MRIWTVHPQYLDRQGLLALWREGLLAQAVLLGKTTGYVHHPQLIRFRDQRSPVAGIAAYLAEVHNESVRRGYRFDRTRIHGRGLRKCIPETEGQLLYEWSHLLSKLRTRSPGHFARVHRIARPKPHPLFTIIPGKVRTWERKQHMP